MNWRGKAGVREPKSRLVQPARPAMTMAGQKGAKQGLISDICKGGSAEFGWESVGG